MAIGLSAPRLGLSIFLGSLWGSLNLYLVKCLLSHLLATQSSYVKISLTAALKFPLLYLAGYALLAFGSLPIAGLTMGFTSIFLALCPIALTLLRTEWKSPSLS